jgi:hypothetical protein
MLTTLSEIKMIAAPRINGFGSGRGGEAGHPGMADTA